MSRQPDQAIPGPDNNPAAPGRHRQATRPGLWERKKARTRAAIREHALRLFREQGYDATTVEQIAAAAEVSPSTFFRYFPAKEDVVLQDDMELRWIEALRALPPDMPPITALHASLQDAFASLSAGDLAKIRETTDLALSVPAVRARMLDEFARTIGVMAAAIAERTGRNPDDFEVRTLAGAALGVAISSWFTAQGDMEQFITEYARALELLLTGLPLQPDGDTAPRQGGTALAGVAAGGMPGRAPAGIPLPDVTAASGWPADPAGCRRARSFMSCRPDVCQVRAFRHYAGVLCLGPVRKWCIQPEGRQLTRP